MKPILWILTFAAFGLIGRVVLFELRKGLQELAQHMRNRR